MAVAASSASASGLRRIPPSSSFPSRLRVSAQAMLLTGDGGGGCRRRRAVEMECFVMACCWENPRPSPDWWNPLFDTQDWSSFAFGSCGDGGEAGRKDEGEEEEDGGEGGKGKGEEGEGEEEGGEKNGGKGCGRLREAERDAEDREL